MSDVTPNIAHQWCCLHDIHQDDPDHDYTYPDCERHLRDSTPEEDAAVVDRTPVMRRYPLPGYKARKRVRELESEVERLRAEVKSAYSRGYEDGSRDGFSQGYTDE